MELEAIGAKHRSAALPLPKWQRRSGMPFKSCPQNTERRQSSSRNLLFKAKAPSLSCIGHDDGRGDEVQGSHGLRGVSLAVTPKNDRASART